MAKLFGLDIPNGLETAFQNALQLKPSGLNLSVANTLPKQNHARKQRTINRSLFILWAPMYDAFTTIRRGAWDTYWGRWPGSGFSAFVQVNAPLYRQGMSLLLDPPGSDGNFITDPNFTMEPNANGWVAGDYDYFEPQRVMLVDNEDGVQYPVFTGLAIGDTVQFQVRVKGLGPWLGPDWDGNGGFYDFQIGSYASRTLKEFSGYTSKWKLFSFNVVLTADDFLDDGGVYMTVNAFGAQVPVNYAGFFKIA